MSEAATGAIFPVRRMSLMKVAGPPDRQHDRKLDGEMERGEELPEKRRHLSRSPSLSDLLFRCAAALIQFAPGIEMENGEWRSVAERGAEEGGEGEKC